MRQIEQFPVSIIEALPDRRSVKAETVDRLVESIKAIGLRTPITVRIMDDFVCADGQKADGVPVLVTGAHRLAAAKRLGWSTIECFMFHPKDGERGDDEITAKLWEISENLHRAELSALERSEQIAEWVRLSEERRQLTQPVSIESKREDGKGHRMESGARAASRELGIDRERVRRAVKIAGLPEEAKRAAEEVGLSDNQSALERAARSSDPVSTIRSISEHKVRAEITKPHMHSIPIDTARGAVVALMRFFTAQQIADAALEQVRIQERA